MKKKKGAMQELDSLPADHLQVPTEAYHIPVLLQEVIGGLAIQPDGVYVDCTFGGGGHSAGILQQLGENGRLFAFDQDADAAANLPADPRLVFIPQNFRHLARFLRLHGITQVNGLMADLGVSSHQFDQGERGFSTRFNAPLDMRMDRRQSLRAADILGEYDEQQLHKLFEKYGEVTNAKTLAKTIVALRDRVALHTIEGFKQAVYPVVKGNPHKYFAQVFQALRIAVNQEMEALEEMLQQSVTVLKPGGRIAIISFHSIEDRIVKNFFRNGGLEPEEAHPFESRAREKIFKIITKKPVTAMEQELRANPRSRSAKLRIGERI